MQLTDFAFYIIVNVFFLSCKASNWIVGTQCLHHQTLIDFLQFHSLHLHPNAFQLHVAVFLMAACVIETSAHSQTPPPHSVYSRQLR